MEMRKHIKSGVFTTSTVSIPAVKSGFTMKSREELEEIFSRLSEDFSFEEAHLELASAKRTDAMIAMMRNVFISDEPLCKTLGIEYDRYLQEVLCQRVQDNLSIVIVSNHTDDIIGFLMSHITRKEDAKNSNMLTGKFKMLMEFLTQKDSQMTVFEKYGVDKAIRIAVVVIDKEFRQKGFALKLLEFALSYYCQTGFRPLIMKAECTSKFSSALFQKAGFEILHELPYMDFKIENNIIFETVRDFSPATIQVKRIDI